MANRLAGETSPYLLQHKDNPVDWYPWGDEAFARARAEDKPVFLSIGYAACHWCHVMEHESFSNPATAALMNEKFVSIKVDREERPDVDTVYMNSIHVMGEGGGWPLSAFLTPDGEPFYVGTYFPPTDRYGKPGFARVLEIMARAWREERDEVRKNGQAVKDALRRIDEHQRRESGGVDLGRLSADLLTSAAQWFTQRADPINGGLGSAPKFPSSSSHELLARAARLASGGPVREAFLRQCDAMAAGGIYDHLGGGFSRYSVDARWRVPHFEKMLYDNAQLLGIYADAYAMTGRATYARVIDETVAWLEREMSDPTGALWASLDADSEGEEGKFYVWTPAQLAAVLGDADAATFAAAYGVTAQGNFEHGTTVLYRAQAPADDEAERALAPMRAELLAARAARIRPGTDDKVLTAWNALAITGLLRAHAATGSAAARALALRVADFLAREMIAEGDDAGPRVLRVWRAGQKKLDGTLDDYAFAAEAFQRLAEATGEARWWHLAERLLGAILARFYDETDGVGVLYMTPREEAGALIHRPESSHDGAIPSGAAVAVAALLRQGLCGGDARALGIAERYLASRAPAAAEAPFSASRLLSALDLYLHGTELVVSDGDGGDVLRAAAGAVYAPALILAGPWAAPDLLAGKNPGADGRARAFVCRGQTCSPPVGSAAELRSLLEQPT